jgi:uncharacterized protein YcbX
VSGEGWSELLAHVFPRARWRRRPVDRSHSPLSAWVAPVGQTSAAPGRGGVVSQLWRYPVKSFRGERLDEGLLDARGVVGDRAFAVRDAAGKFGSGKTTRRFRLLGDLFDFSAESDGGGVIVRAPGGASLPVGDPELDALLSARYGERLAVVAEGAVSHFDAGPVHVLTTSSLRWVEREYGRTGGEARRYRPNIVLETDGGDPVEEGWLGASLSIGSCVLQVSAAVERCVMPTFHQDGLPCAQGLLTFLVERNKSMLGVYANVTSPGMVRVGDLVTVTHC